MNCCTVYGHVMLHIYVYHKIMKYVHITLTVKSPIIRSTIIAEYCRFYKVNNLKSFDAEVVTEGNYVCYIVT